MISQSILKNLTYNQGLNLQNKMMKSIPLQRVQSSCISFKPQEQTAAPHTRKGKITSTLEKDRTLNRAHFCTSCMKGMWSWNKHNSQRSFRSFWHKCPPQKLRLPHNEQKRKKIISYSLLMLINWMVSLSLRWSLFLTVVLITTQHICECFQQGDHQQLTFLLVFWWILH